MPDPTTTPTTPTVPQPPRNYADPLPRPRSLDFALFVAAVLWYLCAQALSSSAASVLGMNFDLGDWRPLLEAALLLILVVCGLSLLRRIERRLAPLRITLGLPRRATSRAEWATGAAIGWGLSVAVVLPMALARSLNTQLWIAPRSFLLLGLSLLTMAIATLACALALYGYGFQRLIDATGPVRATLILIALTAIHAAFTATPYGTPDATRILVALLAALLLSLCWLRSHGLWLAWGLSFAWGASTAVLFGLPLNGDIGYGSIVDTRAAGPGWLTGGEYGPNAALFSVLILLAAIPILVRATSDYAWKYTHPPLIPGGYDVTIAPPAAHVAMEQAASEQAVHPATLVQIQTSTAQSAADDTPGE
ncbi:MAG: CPBP family intramembrane glutamate endopeptidase [Acidobacteriaceae bacterium]